MHGARQQWRDDGNGLVERSSDRAASWSVSEGGRLEVGVTCPRIFEWLPRSNSLFWPRIPCSLKKNSLLGLQNSPFHCSSSGTPLPSSRIAYLRTYALWL
jgi:hypothetical protein